MHVFHAEIQGDGGATAGGCEGGVHQVRQWRPSYDGGAVGEVSSRGSGRGGGRRQGPDHRAADPPQTTPHCPVHAPHAHPRGFPPLPLLF